MFDVTTFLAIWGAILSTFAVGWNFYRDLLDRPKLRVSGGLKRFAKGTDGRDFAVKHNLPVAGASEQVFLLLTAVNVGRRPVMIKGWGGKWRSRVDGKKRFVIIGRDLPKMLKEGEDHSEYTNELRTVSENVKSLYFWDSSGREWKLPKSELEKLKHEASDIQAAGPLSN
jgi:hypothetical protein